jgi:hypothetical protein
LPAAHKIRICDVFSTPWRQTPGTIVKDHSSFDHTEKFQEFITRQQDFPNTLEQLLYHDGTSLSIEGGGQSFADFERVELVLFALPFPVSQVVATLVLDFYEPSFNNDEDNRVRRLMQAAGEGTLQIGGRSIFEIVDELALAVRAEREEDVTAPADERAASPVTSPALTSEADSTGAPRVPLDRVLAGLDRERHTLVFVQPTRAGAAAGSVDPEVLDEVARSLIYGVHWPHRAEFTTIETPKELTRPGQALAAVSHYASVLYGHTDEVHSSVLLSTVQTVGTAARFQWIWQQAYRQVRDFQISKQAHETGKQTRESLAPLADEMGNLELDLTFNVQTAADLGLGSTTALVDSFHRSLHEAMKFKTRAETVATMFQRVNSSIQSELTAIVSREKQEEDERRFYEQQKEDDRRFRGALVLGLLTFLLAPLGLILGYFGINTKEVTGDDSIFYFQRYWIVYALAGLLIAAPVAVAAIFNPAFLRRQFTRPSRRSPRRRGR